MGRVCKCCKKPAGVEGRNLHKFPLNDAALLETWKLRLNLPSTFRPTKYSQICSDHFHEECFKHVKTGKVLIAGSIPSFFTERKWACFYCNNTKDSKPEISLRKFPINNPVLLKQWLSQINIENFAPSRKTLICSDHFDPNCFRRIANRKYSNLKDGAVPTIFLQENNYEDLEPTDELETPKYNQREDSLNNIDNGKGNNNKMVRRCKHCKKEGGSEATTQGRTLHGFPIEDPALLDIWKSQLKLHPSFIPTKNSFICSDHFEKECFRIIAKRRILIPGSVPTIFSERKDSCFYCKVTKDSKPGISLRKFPLDRPELLKKWLLAINVENFNPTKDSLICSDHFERSCFQEIKNRKRFNLRVDAVPSIFFKEKQEIKEEPAEEFAQEHINERLNEPYEELASDLKYTFKPNGSDAASPLLHSGKLEPKEEPEEEPAQEHIHELVIEPYVKESSGASEAASTLLKSVTSGTQDKIAEKLKIVGHDHIYESTPKSDRRKLSIIREKFKKIQQANKIQKRQIQRLNAKVKSLKEIIKELNKQNSIPESKMNCLDSIVNSRLKFTY